MSKSFNLHIVLLPKISPRLCGHCESIFVLSSPHSTGMRAIVKVGESQDLAPDSLPFLSRDLLQGTGFIVHLLRPQGLTITGS